LQSLLQKNYSDLGIDLNFVSSGTSDLGLSAGNNDVETHRYYFTSDHIGSSNVITDASGTPVQQIEYMPFGESYVDWRELSWNTPYRFTGKEQDPETGLYDYGARYYDAKIGRFMSVDPLAADFASWTPYHYVHNNPLRYTDPNGLSADDIIIRGSDGNTFNWTTGATYDGEDEFIKQTVTALNALGANANTANFSFKGRKASGVNFEGNAVLDYASGGSKDYQDVFIKHADNNPAAPGENQHITGTIYWDPSRGIAEEGFNGAEGGGAFPSIGELVHEMGHAALFNEFGGEDWQDRQSIFANEEQMIIDRLEKPAMQSLGFGYRTGHNTYSSRSQLLKNFSGSIKNRLSFVGSYYIPTPSPIKLMK